MTETRMRGSDRDRMSIGPAIWATALALALINLGLAALIAQLMGAGALAPTWAVLGLVAVGVVLAVVAVRLWLQYVGSARER